MRKIKLFFIAMALLCANLAFGQTVTVKGVITDGANGEPVPFAAVQLKGSMTGSSSDADGNYVITAPSNGVLVFSSVGYQTVEVAINGKTTVNCVLPVDTEYLDDVIVVAFGTSTKSSFTGSAKVVKSDDLAKSSVSSVTNALAGKVAGVQLTSSNGAPGASSSIRVRGYSSINAGNDPLIIVDGAPYNGDISSINPSDVESMTVLKDAASNALYGARGANGVIMITTKSAKAGQASITFDAKVGYNERALKDYDIITSPYEHFESHYTALNNYYLSKGLSATDAWRKANANITGPVGNGGLGYDIWTLPAGQYLVGQNGRINPNVKLGKVVGDYYIQPDRWADYAYRKGIRQEYNVAVSGSQSRASFYSSISYLENQGITTGSDMTRLTARLKADYQAREWLKVGANASYSKFDYNSLGNNGSSTSTGNVWAFTSQMAPIYPLYMRNADGSFMYDSNGIQMYDYGDGMNAGMSRPFITKANPLKDNELNTRNNEGNALSANGYANITILPGLVVTLNGTTNLDETRTTYVYNPYYGQFTSTGGMVEKENSRTYNYDLQQLINYSRSFGMHNVSVLLGHEYYYAMSNYLYASHNKMFSQSNKELDGAVVDSQSSGSGKSEYNNEGYFSRLQYDYDSRLFASASYRRDASSRFAPENRWGSFWSVGGAWLVSKENWFNVSQLQELKLKASIGSQGNDNISNYMYTDMYDITNSAGDVATSFSSKGSRGITWETNTNFNVGAEFTAFNRLTGSVEFFNRKTTDMLFSFSVAPSMGYSSYWANVGDMWNKGVEFDMNLNIINTKNVQWDFNFNITALKNQISALDDDKKTTTKYDLEGNKYEGYNSGSYFYAEGLSMYTFYLKEYAGVDQETGLSQWYKRGDEGELETTTTYSEADYFVTRACGLPKAYGGFGTSINAFGFDFAINFSYQLGGLMTDNTYAAFMAPPTSNNSGYATHRDFYKSWTKENPSTTIPRYQFDDTYAASSSTRFLTNASYLNIENINFGYTIPSKLTKKISVDKLRLYLACENVAYFAARRGFDPRQGHGSSNATNYSPMRSLSAGVSVKF